MRIDFHTHVFPERTAQRAVKRLNTLFGVRCSGAGSPSALAEDRADAGIETSVVLCCAERPSLVVPVNNFALQMNQEKGCIAFGTVHPDAAAWEQELARLEKGGIHGIKLHPEYQGIDLDDERLMPVYEACQGRFCVLVHTGGSVPNPVASKASPGRLMRVLENFPRLDIVAAHFGGQGVWGYASECLRAYRGEHLWLDTSSSTAFLDGAELRELFSMQPFERFLFGSDWPIYKPEEELYRLRKLSGFGDDKIEALLGNGESLLAEYHMF